MSIAHERDKEGHADEADAIATAVFDVIEKKEEELSGILHYEGLGMLWVERNPESPPEPFNWPHVIHPGDPDYDD